MPSSISSGRTSLRDLWSCCARLRNLETVGNDSCAPRPSSETFHFVVPTRPARFASGATSPQGGEVNTAQRSFDERSPFRTLLLRSSPPARLASRAGRPPHEVGRWIPPSGRLMNDLPSEPFYFVAPHPPGSLRELGGLPTRWGGEQLRSLSLAL